MVEVTHTYKVQASRDGRFWFLEVPELGQATQARHTQEVEEMVRDLIAIHTDSDPGSFDVAVEYVLPAKVVEARSEADRLRRVAEESNAAAAAKSREAANLLRSQGLTVRDIGAVLGVSHQRAQQLTKS